ncbi:hypothetical protein [Luteolibacter sp. Populi]|uniref:hypothetical protein n=1 Tax=Luteolibacter sp. Populi TaxID=3230487 RepID=UPI003467D26B
MKTLLLLALGLLFLSGCNRRKDTAATTQPPALGLIADAELAESGVTSAASIHTLGLSQEKLTNSLGNKAQREKAKLEVDADALELKETQAKDKAATAALRAYTGTAYEKAEIATYFERRKLRSQIAAKEKSQREATEADDSVSTKKLFGEIEALRKKLETLNEEWIATFYGGDWKTKVGG